MIDVSHTIVAKSDQLNADDLIGGEILAVVESVKVESSPDQPVSIWLIDRPQPWKPCKTMRRVLVAAWGADATHWIGKSMLLYRDDSVTWAGEAVGGLRLRALSHIPSRINLMLAAKRGKKVQHTINVLPTPEATVDASKPKANPLNDFFAACETKLALKREDVRKWWEETNSAEMEDVARKDLKVLFDSLSDPKSDNMQSLLEFISKQGGDK